jgi:hypothetical protein
LYRLGSLSLLNNPILDREIALLIPWESISDEMSALTTINGVVIDHEILYDPLSLVSAYLTYIPLYGKLQVTPALVSDILTESIPGKEEGVTTADPGDSLKWRSAIEAVSISLGLLAEGERAGLLNFRLPRDEPSDEYFFRGTRYLGGEVAEKPDAQAMLRVARKPSYGKLVFGYQSHNGVQAWCPTPPGIPDITLGQLEGVTKDGEEYGVGYRFLAAHGRVEALGLCLKDLLALHTSQKSMQKWLNEHLVPDFRRPGKTPSYTLKVVKFKPEEFTIMDIINLATEDNPLSEKLLRLQQQDALRHNLAKDVKRGAAEQIGISFLTYVLLSPLAGVKTLPVSAVYGISKLIWKLYRYRKIETGEARSSQTDN